jgi:hypothetical protein
MLVVEVFGVVMVAVQCSDTRKCRRIRMAVVAEWVVESNMAYW